jgi:hypothetical protein
MDGEAPRHPAQRPQTRSASQSGTVDVRRLKDFALTLPKGSSLKDLLVSEDDELDVREFLVKMGVWLKLLRMGPS